MDLQAITIGEIVMGGTLVITIWKSYEWYHNMRSKENKLEYVLKALLSVQLIDRFRILKERGSLSILDRKTLADLYEQYKALGGNGALAELYDDVMHLPTDVI